MTTTEIAPPPPQPVFDQIIGRFLDEACTVRAPGDRLVRSRPRALYDALIAWCIESGEPLCTMREFSRQLEARGYVTTRSHGKRWRLGIAVGRASAGAPSRTLDDDAYHAHTRQRPRSACSNAKGTVGIAPAPMRF